MKRLSGIGWIVVFFMVLGMLWGCGAAPLPKSLKTDYDVVVIGAGMGGLSAGVHLAAGGMKVLVLEQHDKVGGCTTSFARGEFNFDAALHEMSLGGGKGVIRDLLDEVGVLDKIELIRIPEIGRSIFPGLDFKIASNEKDMIASLCAQWPDECPNVVEFHKVVGKMNSEVAQLREIYFANPVKALFTKLAVPLRQRTLTKYNKYTIQEFLDDFFTDEQLKSVLAQFWIYHGPPPSEQWALMYFVAHYTYLITGAWQIRGSSQALSNAYAERIEELGGTVETDTLVTRIILDDEDRARGVEVAGGKQYTSRYVVSNADPQQTFFKMIDKERVPRRLKKKIASMEPSNSFAGVYLGLDVPLSHFGVPDYEVILNASFDEDEMYENMLAGDYDKGLLSVTFYSNLGDDFYAPEGKSVIVLHTYSDMKSWPKRGDAYEAKKDKMVEDLIRIAEERLLPGLSEHIIFKEGMTPRTILAYTMQPGGVPYGWKLTPEQHDRLPISTPFDGLYHVGSWAWPAHSVTMTQLSGYLAAQLILKREEKRVAPAAGFYITTIWSHPNVAVTIWHSLALSLSQACSAEPDRVVVHPIPPGVFGAFVVESDRVFGAGWVGRRFPCNRSWLFWDPRRREGPPSPG